MNFFNALRFTLGLCKTTCGRGYHEAVFHVSRQTTRELFIAQPYRACLRNRGWNR